MRIHKARNIRGFLVGHAEDGHTGVTAVLAPRGAVAGVDVRGSAPGTRETDLLRGCNQVTRIHAVTLCGGSAFGLDACGGVMQYLYENKIGFKTATHRVPIVSGAVLYDLLDKDVLHYPDRAMGYRACEAAVPIADAATGSVGAGKGATVGKIRGAKNACKGGLGIASLKWMGATVTAIVAVNALGDVYDEKTNEVVAGARAKDGSFIDTERVILDADLSALMGGTNTTIGCVLTDARITREEANKIASVAHDGLARSIRPIHTLADGDTMFCMSAGRKRVNFIALCTVAAEATRLAVLDAVAKKMIGVDMEEIARFRDETERARLIGRVCTERERTYLAEHGGSAETLAGLWCAKEACVKALGTGFGEIGYTDIEVRRDAAGKPFAYAAKLGLEFEISISHTRELCVAIAAKR